MSNWEGGIGKDVEKTLYMYIIYNVIYYNIMLTNSIRTWRSSRSPYIMIISYFYQYDICSKATQYNIIT